MQACRVNDILISYTKNCPCDYMHAIKWWGTMSIPVCCFCYVMSVVFLVKFYEISLKIQNFMLLQWIANFFSGADNDRKQWHLTTKIKPFHLALHKLCSQVSRTWFSSPLLRTTPAPSTIFWLLFFSNRSALICHKTYFIEKQE